MRTHRWMTIERPEPRPFQIVDAEGRACGEYPTMPEVLRALETLRKFGTSKAYRLADAPAPKKWMAA